MEILTSDRFRKTLQDITRNSAIEMFGSAITGDTTTEPVDWSHALFCASALTGSTSERAQDAALRVAQGCLSSIDSRAHHREAATLLLERLGNRPSIALAERRNLIESDSWSDAPGPLRLETLRKRLALTVDSTKKQFSVNSFQSDFWNAALSNDWVSASAPTSAGKSFIVKRWFERRIATADQIICIYLVPTRALIDEVTTDFRQDSSFLETGIYKLPWDSEIGSKSHEIHVVTQERPHVLQKRFPDFSPALVFVDEAQKFGDDARGVLLQQVLAETIRRNPQVQVLLASPLSANPDLLLNYAPRSSRRAAVASGAVTVNQNLIWVNQVRGRPTKWEMQIVFDSEAIKMGEFMLPARPVQESKRLPFVAVSLGQASIGNVVYVNGAAAAEKAAQQIYDALGAGAEMSEDVEIAALVELIEKTIHPRYALSGVLRRGVAFHYGNMPLLVRSEIERLFREEKLRYLVCTSTLLEGVNLPCRTLFVRGPRKGTKPMSSADFWNLAGRAGRWGKEFQGNIVCVDTSKSEQWPIVPSNRVRQPLRRAADAVLAEADRFLDYVRSETPIRDSREWLVAESVYSMLVARMTAGQSLQEMPELADSDLDTNRLEIAIEESLSSVTIPAEIYTQHAGISPVAMERLLSHLRERNSLEGLRLPPPEDEEAAIEYVRAISRIEKYLGGSYGNVSGRQMQLAILMVNWMRGQPLAWLISERVRYNETRAKPQNLGAVIRSTMVDVEQFARFEAPKFFSCYIDVVRHYLTTHNLDSVDDIELPDIEMMLELGVSRTTELSLMTLGLSRTSTVALSEFIASDSLTPPECLDWLSKRDLMTLDLPELVRREIAILVPEEGRAS